MTETTEKQRTPRKRAAPPPSHHADMTKLIEQLKRLADTFEPLAEHVPVLVEVAKTWNAAATTGRTIGRGASMLSAFGKWVGGAALSLAILWALIHQKWEALLGALK